MNRRQTSNGNRHHLKLSNKSPTLEIDLKKLSPIPAEHKSTKYHTSIDLTDFIENTPTILRPMTVDSLTPQISKHWPKTEYSFYDDGWPLEKSKYSSRNQASDQCSIEKRKYLEVMAKLDKLLEDEEEEYSTFSEFSNEMEEKPLKHLDSLISKIKITSREIKNNPEKSVLFLKQNEKEKNSNSNFNFSNDETEEFSDLNTNSLELQCNRLNKYLEDNKIQFENDEIEFTHATKKSKKVNESKKSPNSNASFRSKKSSNSRGYSSKSYMSNRSIVDDFNSPNNSGLSSPIQRKKIVSSSNGILSQKYNRRKNSPLKNASIMCEIDEFD